MNGLSRRRFIAIAAVGLAGRFTEATAAPPPPAIWQGIALGAKAEIRIDGRADAAPVINSVRREIDRLEKLFSLYRTDSAIARLNRNGALADPDPDFLALLSAAAVIHRATGGLFDPTVQPIWDAYARAYGGGPISEDAEDVIAAVAAKNRSRAGFKHVDFGPDEIVFRRRGMALTLNGIAQGYITDRIADLLGARGLQHVLVDIGEIRALGSRRDGSGWPVQIPAPGSGPVSRRTIFLEDRALATSAALGTTFDAAGHFGHILDPRSGAPLTRHRQVTIEAPSATIADGLSTALCLMPDESDATLALNAFPDTRLHIME